MRRFALAAAIGLALGACRVPNTDHCVHRDIDSDAWCEENVPGTRYCSPCVADLHGCVVEDPALTCPSYTPDGYSSGVVTDAGGPPDDEGGPEGGPEGEL